MVSVLSFSVSAGVSVATGPPLLDTGFPPVCQGNPRLRKAKTRSTTKAAIARKPNAWRTRGETEKERKSGGGGGRKGRMRVEKKGKERRRGDREGEKEIRGRKGKEEVSLRKEKIGEEKRL